MWFTILFAAMLVFSAFETHKDLEEFLVENNVLLKMGIHESNDYSLSYRQTLFEPKHHLIVFTFHLKHNKSNYLELYLQLLFGH